MRRCNIGYYFGQSFKGLWRNGIMTVASVTVLMSCLVLIGSFSALVYNIDRNLEEVGVLNEISVVVDYDTDEDTVAAIGEQIRSLDNVANVEFVSKEQALESERERYAEYAYLFDELKEDNPLPDIYRVTYASNENVETLVYQLGQIDHVKVKSRIDIAKDIENLKSGISLVFIWFLVILFIVSIFIIINTIKLTVEARAREIEAMRYIGATNFFMSAPFILEGALIGVIAAALASLIGSNLYLYVYHAVSNKYRMISVVPFDQLRSYMLIGFFSVGILAGVIGSAISLRKYKRI